MIKQSLAVFRWMNSALCVTEDDGDIVATVATDTGVTFAAVEYKPLLLWVLIGQSQVFNKARI